MIEAQERPDGKIICMIDNAPTHTIPQYLREKHPEVTVNDYKARFPGAPLFSKKAEEMIAEQRRKNAAEAVVTEPGVVKPAIDVSGKKAMGDVFGFGNVPGVKNAKGDPIMIDVFGEPDEDMRAFIPEIDPNYIFDIDTTKDGIIAFVLNTPCYFWGYHGSGKTSSLEQICARTMRPFMRNQHTVDMETAHVIGQYTVRNGETIWQDGPLPIAMKAGAVYCADEYDAALPGVIALYQAVLEGKPLIIKEAPPEYRVVKPHPNFRFVATGNTNGAGDETGLYQGTQMQNMANYSRFGVTRKIDYLSETLEATAISSQARLTKADGTKFVKFAKQVREAHAAGTMACIISTRELITAGRVAVVKGGAWVEGLKSAFINRQSRVDQEVLLQLAQRIFG